jgi:hypothetical protein
MSMQVLLVLLRTSDPACFRVRFSSESALQEALGNLRTAIEEGGAVVTHDSLPLITTDHTQQIKLPCRESRTFSATEQTN